MIKKLKMQIWQQIIGAIILQAAIPAIILLGIKATGWMALLTIFFWQTVLEIVVFMQLQPIVLAYYKEKRRIEFFPLTEDLNEEVGQILEKDVPAQKQELQNAYEAYSEKGQCLKL